MTTPNAEPPAGGGEIIAKPDRWYALKWYAMSLALVLGGAWFLYDGYVKWPAENEAARQKRWDRPPHSDLNLLLQRVIGFGLPPLGIACGIWTAWGSRGEYRFTPDNVLHVPGHPPVPLGAIREIDKRRWDRKGVAYLAYELPSGAGSGRLKLDDYVYDRKPTDAILARIEAEVLPADGGNDADAPPRPPVVSESLESRDMI